MLVLKNAFRNIFFLFLMVSGPLSLYGDNHSQSLEINSNVEVDENEAISQNILENNRAKICKKHNPLSYYLYIQDFVQSFIEIPTANVLVDSTTLSSTYLAGRAPVYNRHNEKVGTCSASFLCMQNESGIYTDISNYLSIDNGLIVTWFTPTTLINLELDSIVHSMVTECIVLASTKVGFNPFYGKTFNMIVSSDDQKIYFKLSEI